MAWMRRSKNRTTESDQTSLTRSEPTPSPGILPPPRVSNEAVTTTSALSLAAVYRAVSIIATGVSQMSIDVWRGSDPIDAPSWVRRPDMKLSRSAFYEQTTVSLAAHGNAFWRIIRDTPTDPIKAAVVLDPTEVVVDETNGKYHWRGKELQPWQCQHLSLLRVPGSPYGLGPIQAARPDLRGVLDARDYAAEWFDRSGVPTGILSSDQPLSPDQAADYKALWDTNQAHRSGTAVLGSGLNYSPLLLNPKDAQFLESQQFNVTQVARLFGIPAHMLLAAVEGTSMTYTNLADADLAFVRWTLTQYLREIEEAISVLLPRGQTARFNLDAVLRPSTKARYEAHEIALRAKFMTVNEVRAIEGLKPATVMLEPEGETA